MAGLIVMLVGVLFLLRNLGLIPHISWDIIWPVFVIIVGISMMERRYWWGSSCRWRWRRGRKFGRGEKDANDSPREGDE